MTNYCECGGRVALSSANVFDIQPDQEPYDSGFIEEIEDDAQMKINHYEIIIRDPVNVLINSCVKCGKVYNAEVSDRFDDKYAKTEERFNNTQITNHTHCEDREKARAKKQLPISLGTSDNTKKANSEDRQ